MAERSEAKSAKRSFASKIKIGHILEQSFASLFSQNIAERSEAKSAKQSFASKMKIRYFDAKLRFAPLASLRSAVFGEIQVDNYLVIFLTRVNKVRSLPSKHDGLLSNLVYPQHQPVIDRHGGRNPKALHRRPKQLRTCLPKLSLNSTALLCEDL